MLMDTLRKITIGLCALLLGPVLFSGIVLFGVNQTIGNAEYVKQTFRRAEVFPALGKQISVAQSGENKKGAEAAIKVTADAQTMQAVGDQAVNSLFGFLQGNTPAQEISVDITPLTKNLDKELVKEVQTQLKKDIKNCKAGQQTSPELNCEQLKTQLEQADGIVKNILGENGALADGKLSLGDLQQMSGNNNAGQTQETIQTLQNLSTLYRIAQWGVAICGVLSVILISLIIVLSRVKLLAVRRVGTILLLNGLLIVVALFVVRLIRGYIPDSGTEDLASALTQAGGFMAVDIAARTMIAGGILFVIGLGAIIVSSILLKKQSPPTKAAEPSTADKEANPTVQSSEVVEAKKKD